MKAKHNYPSAGQGVLAGLEAPDALRHPMWTKPSTQETLSLPVRAVREAMARSVTPFDGREDMEIILHFCEAVYAATERTDLAENGYWLAGRIVFEQVKVVERLQQMIHVCQPATRALYQRDVNVIERLGREWAAASARTLLT